MNQLLMMMISTLSHLLTCTNTSISSAKSANSLGIILAMKQQSELQKLIDNTKKHRSRRSGSRTTKSPVRKKINGTKQQSFSDI